MQHNTQSDLTWQDDLTVTLRSTADYRLLTAMLGMDCDLLLRFTVSSRRSQRLTRPPFSCLPSTTASALWRLDSSHVPRVGGRSGHPQASRPSCPPCCVVSRSRLAPVKCRQSNVTCRSGCRLLRVMTIQIAGFCSVLLLERRSTAIKRAEKI